MILRYECDPARHRGKTVPATWVVRASEESLNAPYHEAWACCDKHLPIAIAAWVGKGQRKTVYLERLGDSS